MEQAKRFLCGAESHLTGILHLPGQTAHRAVVIVVGGPQYRVGSHRQFVLLARHLADHGVAVLRFDYRGMGDSEGDVRDFEHIGDDIKAAVDHLCREVGVVRDVVLWGLCDAATACAFYAGSDPRVSGLVLVNPWVRSQQGEAQTYLRHYYIRRLISPGFWKKMLAGSLDLRASLSSFKQYASNALHSNTATAKEEGGAGREAWSTQSLERRMADGLERFEGRVLFILSGNDLTAREFVDVTSSRRRWKRVFSRRGVERRELPDADHTFSRRVWRDTVADSTRKWLQSW